jgi:hypothetical protein
MPEFESISADENDHLLDPGMHIKTSVYSVKSNLKKPAARPDVSKGERRLHCKTAM